jgi:hypothetical protein
MAKRNLFGDCVLRRDGIGRLYLMKLEGGWNSPRISIVSEQDLLAEYNVRLGDWTRDEVSDFCPVVCIPRSEQPTLHEGEEPPFVLDDIGPRGQVGDTELEAFKRLLAAHQGLNFVCDSFEPDPEKSEAFNRFVAQTDGYKVRHDGPVLVGDEITPERVREIARAIPFGIGVELLTPIDASDPNEPWSNAAIRRVLKEHPEIIHDFGTRGLSPLGTDLTKSYESIGRCYKVETDPATGHITIQNVPEKKPTDP